jgi:hypothetical protein
MIRAELRRCGAATEIAAPFFVFSGQCRFVFLALLLLLISPGAVPQSHDDRSVKAAFVFNLTKYVEWPQSSEEMVIGYLGEERTGEIFKKMLDGKSSGSRSIRVILLPSATDLERCQLLYVAEPSEKKVRAALDLVRGKSVLTVGDTDSFVREGGMIGLVTVGEQIQIQVGLEVVQESRLKVSSRLLSIATLVRPGPEAKTAEAKN